MGPDQTYLHDTLCLCYKPYKQRDFSVPLAALMPLNLSGIFFAYATSLTNKGTPGAFMTLLQPLWQSICLISSDQMCHLDSNGTLCLCCKSL